MANVALGQGQAPAAIRMIQDGSRDGNWVFLANCHLMLSWMTELEKVGRKPFHPRSFRLNGCFWSSFFERMAGRSLRGFLFTGRGAPPIAK